MPEGDSPAENLTSQFPPIADYGFLSDCETNSLVAPDGAVEWMCLPRPDSPTVFGAILDRGAGLFRFGPSNTHVPHQRRYLPGTMVLETTWHTPTGWLLVQDLLVVRPVEAGDRRPDYRRAPGDHAATGTLLRLATCIEGRVEVMVNAVPYFEYGTVTGTWAYDGQGYGSMTVHPPGGDPVLTLTSSLRLGVTGARCYGRSTLNRGETAFVAMSWRGHAPTSVPEAQTQLADTIAYWRDWLATGTFPDHPWRSYIERSALTLKGLSYAPTGAIMAAATTSLPETPGGARNWDYRYTWIRDSSFMLRSLYRLGFDWEALEYFAFVLEAVGGTAQDDWDLQIMYGIGGEKDLTERTLDHLSGYRNSSPV
jgi:GH15 family glucan-1,4-alpha-glucosidase